MRQRRVKKAPNTLTVTHIDNEKRDGEAGALFLFILKQASSARVVGLL